MRVIALALTLSTRHGEQPSSGAMLMRYSTCSRRITFCGLRRNRPWVLRSCGLFSLRRLRRMRLTRRLSARNVWFLATSQSNEAGTCKRSSLVLEARLAPSVSGYSLCFAELQEACGALRVAFRKRGLPPNPRLQRTPPASPSSPREAPAA